MIFSRKPIGAALTLILSLPVASHAIEVLEDFNNVENLANRFTSDATPQFSALANGGIGDTGSVDVPLSSQDVWTTKTAYSMSGAGDEYQISAYFKIQANAGYGGLGLAVNSENEPLSRGSIAEGLGVTFHGGGGAFENDGTPSNLSWGTDLVLGNWYQFVYTVSRTSTNTFDVQLDIINSDENGVLGSVFTTQTEENIENSLMGAADRVYVYFSSYGSRMEKIDNFNMTLSGNASFIPPSESAPTFTSQPVDSASVDTPYTYTVAATDEDSGDTLAISAATLPTWLSLDDYGDGTASLTGTPTTSDVEVDNLVRLKVTDSVFDTYQEFTISISSTDTGDQETTEDQETSSSNGGGSFGLGLGWLMLPTYLLRRRLMK